MPIYKSEASEPLRMTDGILDEIIGICVEGKECREVAFVPESISVLLWLNSPRIQRTIHFCWAPFWQHLLSQPAEGFFEKNRISRDSFDSNSLE
jgi:hypothetical protein